ncbi:GPW/gp25 family protein [Neisseria meningitidis]|uniref:GPW/gp25 family protein n=1 Tax=Neisseria meningitidis TaxID=487 RepID=UPI000BB632EB|nr:GPW/gp25 family protein [Neisseria meningitidis]
MMDAKNGRLADTAAHIRQSVENILFTRIGTRLMREEYGSLLPELIDMPITPALLLQCRTAVVVALARWEPRIDVQTATVAAGQGGSLKISINARIRRNGQAVSYEIEKTHDRA